MRGAQLVCCCVDIMHPLILHLSSLAVSSWYRLIHISSLLSVANTYKSNDDSQIMLCGECRFEESRRLT